MKLLDKAQLIHPEKDRNAFIGEMIYYSYHDGEEYMSVQDIMDNEKAHNG